MLLPMRPVMPLPNRAVEPATREHGHAEDRRGMQRRAEPIGQAPKVIPVPFIREEAIHVGRRGRSEKKSFAMRPEVMSERCAPLLISSNRDDRLVNRDRR